MYKELCSWAGEKISANWDQQIFQFPACNGRNTRHWLGETRMKNIIVQAVQAIQSLCHLLKRAILQEFHNTKCIVYRCYLWYKYSPCMVLWQNWCEFHCARPRLHSIFTNLMMRNSEGVRRHESDAPLFGVSLSMQFKLANCACARGGVKLLNPSWEKSLCASNFEQPFWSCQAHAWEAARYMPETVDTLQGKCCYNLHSPTPMRLSLHTTKLAICMQ